MIELWRFAVPVVASLVLAGRAAVSGVRTAGQFAPPCLVLLTATGLALRLWRRRYSGTAGHA